MYSFLMDQQEQAAVTKASTISKNHILDAPGIPFREESPSLPVWLGAGAFLGFVLGVGLVLWRRSTATTFSNESELRSWLGDLPVLCVIPAHPTPSRGRASSPAPALELELAPRSGFAEAFRHLRANIYRSVSSGSVIVVTSPSARDGKSLTCSALGAILAADGRRVLVIDGTPRAPGNGATPQWPGLAGVLGGVTRFKGAIVRMGTAVGAFDFLPAGRGVSSGELLSGAPFLALLGDLRKIYDIVIIDAPPFPAFCDAFSLSSSVDAILSVIRVKRTDRASAAAHVDQLGPANPRYAVVINADHTGQPKLVADMAPAQWSNAAAPTTQSIADGQPSAE
jgi:tyrosine-protein kinase Etk/Wzc